MEKIIALQHQSAEHKANISGLKSAVYGDNNGKRGLVRRVDGLQNTINWVLKLNWAIVLMLLSLMGKMFYDLFTK